MAVPSNDSAAPALLPGSLITGPRWAGADQGSEVLARVESHKEMLPRWTWLVTALRRDGPVWLVALW